MMTTNAGLSMAKRFIDTDLFRKGFIKSLSPLDKLLWIYIITDCNHAGIWEVEFDVANIRLGNNYFEPQATEIFKDRIIVFDDKRKWFIPAFIEFQYGILNQNVNAHKSVLSILEAKKLLKHVGANQQFINSSSTVKDKDKDKDKVINENFNIFWSVYPKKKSKGIAEKTWVKLKKSKELPEIDIIINAVKIQKESFDWKKEAGQFIPHPSTWLNAKGWENEENKISEQKRDLMAEAFSRKG